ncbi:MAG: SpoIIE family protein phosphatase [Sedimentisphaerales bacterium]|nr:SpoIIE family protein phosphatase [Sedimentisphaerales bacterium]
MVRKSKEQLEKDDKIYQLTTLVAGEFSLQEVLDKLAEAAVKVTSVKACSIRLLNEQAGGLQMRSTYGLSEEYRNKGVVSKDDPVIKAAFAGEAMVLDDMRVDGRVTYRDAVVKEGLISQLTVAMQFRNKNIGVIRLYSPTPKRFDEDSIKLARVVASQCAVAITNAQLYSRAIEGARLADQMRLAGVIQRRMIPEKAPKMQHLDIAAKYIPCFDVGGDLYDFIRLSENQLVIAIADVIGKGIPAAVMTSMFKGAIRAYADAGGAAKINETITRLNRMACEECRDGEFVTLFYALIDTEKMKMSYCSCGHEPTLLIRAAKVSELSQGGLVLGVDKEASYEIETIDLLRDDCLLFYTDGLIDAMNYKGSLWGKELMLEAAGLFSCDSASVMIDNLLGYRRRFVGLSRQIDDTSIVVVKVKDNKQSV